ncbi:MAG: glycosyltransferase, partial [Oscillospiraceae bacterium]|nr:glycosyltransferase [Oscillospiraceae bacterium]
MELFDPSSSAGLAAFYDVDSLCEGKKKNKLALQKAVGLNEDADAALLVMVSRLVEHKGIDLLCHIAERLMQRKVQMLIIGTGEEKYEWFLSGLADRFRGQAAVSRRFDPKLANLAYAAADIYLMPSKSEPCGLSQLIAMRFGAVPVVNSTGGLRDTVLPYDSESEEGRGYTFQSYNADDFLAAIDRSLELFYGDREKWVRLAKNNMRIDSSWQQPAEQYMKLYKEMIG